MSRADASTEPATEIAGGRPGRSRHTRGRSGMPPLRGLLPLAIGLLAWQLLADPGSPYFPPPSRWFAELWASARGGELLVALAQTTVTLFLGLLAATVGGAVLGALIGASRGADRAAGPTLEFLRVLPAAALVPLAALLLGYTQSMKLAVVVLPAMWPVLLTVRAARRSVSPVLLDVTRTLGLSWWQRTRKVLVPSLTPSVLLGVRVAGPLALIISLLVEIVTRIDGIGALMGAAQANFRSAQVFGLLVVAGVLGFIVNLLVNRAEEMVRSRLSGEVRR
ncbi:ABC transporter permease [Pseudonocardia kongjuensis]|uniref:ABC transporter permease n=2 Tax=Pseudonocardia kongjuensis TaxID=102227 RepID=A0ABN1XHE6_9PSEU